MPPIPDPIHPQYYSHGATRLAAGLPPDQLRAEMIAHGLAPAAAAHVVATLVERRPLEARQPTAAQLAAQAEMRSGALICAIGILITSVTYSNAAHSAHGGTYVMAWGPIVFGAARFFRGLAKQ
ncbi:MAG: hypothetical protein K8W52_41830 [Deltaproteobacteria bacterium]|nr:hypothetical protein [Deltaproteobacteria bacterium]